ncbi:MAG: metalloregulator ArsR/SmtB family transcription factor [Caulobacteraceae bacterium]
MRPLFHPSIEDVRLEAILHALSDPARVALFTAIAGGDCAVTCSGLAGAMDLDIPKSTLSQHFKVLREAGLIRSERQGVEMRNISALPRGQRTLPGPAAGDLRGAQAPGGGLARPVA